MRRPRYLRASVTGRCNLRCTYCGPQEADGPDAADREIGPAALETLVRAAAAEGVRKVRITGGEPLMRDDLESLVGAARDVDGIDDVALTTNGIGLAERARGLNEAGLDRVNISLDTLDPATFRRIAGRGGHSDVLDGIRAASGVFPVVKLNTVVMAGVNDGELLELVRFAGREGLWIRFIEKYVSDVAGASGEELDADEIEEQLRSAFGRLVERSVDPLSVERGYRVPAGGDARVGIIAARGGPSCSDCAKLRFTADGRLLPCLFARSGVAVWSALEDGDEEAVRRCIRECMARKCGARLSTAASAPISRLGG